MNTVAVDTQTMLKRFRIIEEKKDGLVEKVEQFFNARSGGPKVPVKRAQLQNLLRLALATSSVKEIQLFIRYQQGRDSKWKSGGFGQTLESAIQTVADEEPHSEVRIDLVRLFIGYLVREARFHRQD